MNPKNEGFDDDELLTPPTLTMTKTTTTQSSFQTRQREDGTRRPHVTQQFFQKYPHPQTFFKRLHFVKCPHSLRMLTSGRKYHDFILTFSIIFLLFSLDVLNLKEYPKSFFQNVR